MLFRSTNDTSPYAKNSIPERLKSSQATTRCIVTSILPLLLYHSLSPLPTCLMSLTPPTTPLQKIRLHSRFLHDRLPQMLPRVQYARQSKTPLSRSVSLDSSESAKMDPPTSPVSISHILTNLLLVKSMTPIKKISHHQHLLLLVTVPPFKQKPSEEHEHLSHSPTTNPSTEHFSLPSQEYETTSTVAVHTNSRLKRSSELAELSSTAEPPAMMKKPHFSWRSWTTSEGWNLERSQIPLHHHHPLTSPFRHQPYHTTRKSWPVPQPPAPESVQWPADRLRPSRRIPMDHGVRGLKLVTWELKYRLFQKVFESELSCCLLARQEELKRRLP